MKSNIPKVLHRVAGPPMLFFPINVLKTLKAGRVVVVIGFGAEEVRAAFKGECVSFCVQEEQLGTGHAVMVALKELKGFEGDVLILSGDVPLITIETVTALIGLHRKPGRRKASLTLVTTVLEDPNGYGRIVRDDLGDIVRIVEDKDCSPLQKKIREVNAGIYLASAKFLNENIKRIGKNNAQGEYYLPDLVELAVSEGGGIDALVAAEPIEVMGINNRVELARADACMRRRVNETLMLSGVTIVDPEATYIDYGASIGMDTIVYPGASISGDSLIGSRSVIEEGSRIDASKIGDGVVIRSYSVIESSEVKSKAAIGPFAHLRPGSVVGEGAHIGNFVEIKQSSIGKGSKANHLSYIGDSIVGEDVNIGAGAITCNYDGVEKHQTTIEDGAFIGSDSQLVAPVKVGKGAYVGSGTTVTKDVPPGALVITRSPEKVIEGWVKRKLKGKEKG